MKKVAFIPTREHQEYPICSYLKEAGFEVHLLVNQESIFKAYTQALHDYSISAEDIVILCHDDIQVLTDKSVFTSILDTKLADDTVGFIGVAGTQFLNRSAVWWEGVGAANPSSPTNALLGCVFHGTTVEDMQATYYGQFSEAVVMDGLFLAAKGKTLFKIGTSKPPYLTGNWDFYDVLYTFKAFRAGLKNMVVPIQILHKSFGMRMQEDSWTANRDAFIGNYSDCLPAAAR